MLRNPLHFDVHGGACFALLGKHAGILDGCSCPCTSCGHITLTSIFHWSGAFGGIKGGKGRSTNDTAELFGDQFLPIPL